MAGFNLGTGRLRDVFAGWRGLARFWGGLAGLAVVTGAVLQIMGPPADPYPKRAESGSSAVGSRSHASRPAEPHSAPTSARLAGPISPGRAAIGPIADPDSGLLEPDPADPRSVLPRISADGRSPMAVYAAGFDPANPRPRVGILIAGIGMSEADSLTAIKTLPGAVTLAVSPYYAVKMSEILSAVRITAHEYLLSIPMEPQGFPANDPDDRYALMTSQPIPENLKRLHAFLGRITGYVGITNALGIMRGERLSDVADQIDPVLADAANRGLLFVDARVGKPRLGRAWNRSADVVLDDEPYDTAELDRRLESLAQMALDRKAALGIVSVPRPVTVERVAAWAATLDTKGLVLAPVSALVLPPAKEDVEK